MDPTEKRTRNDGPHVPKQHRGEPVCNLPPCCKATLGYPNGLSPFIQVRLPKGYLFKGKESRAMSYRDADGLVVPRGTTRTYAMAVQSVESWAWSWFEDLPSATQASLRASVKEHLEERPLKKQKT